MTTAFFARPRRATRVEAGPESVSVWDDSRAVALPPGVRPLPTRHAARAMLATLGNTRLDALTSGQLARWGHLGQVQRWWEPRMSTSSLSGWPASARLRQLMVCVAPPSLPEGTI